MSEYFDEAEQRDRAEREAELFARLAQHLPEAVTVSEGLANHLDGHDLSAITSRQALASLPVLRKSQLMEAQAANPPFGGFANADALRGNRVFLSPGPIWEPQGLGADPWLAARALFAAGFRAGDVVHNALSYHMTPGAFIIEEGLRALGCTVFPAGTGNTQMQVEAAAALKPIAYVGTPDYLMTMLDAADEHGFDLSSITKALVSGGALFPSMRASYAERGVRVMQAYATADLGVIAYESAHEGELVDGMMVNEDLIVEIVRPGTDIPVEAGEVGELVVTNFSTAYPLVRFATGDLSASMTDVSPCGRTNMRIRGWMGRADQRTKVKGMFVDPKQIGQLRARHPEITGVRLVVSREGTSDAMVLRVTGEGVDAERVEQTLRDVTKLGGSVETVDSLPNDGKVIADERDYES
ncbi:MAG: phenylacetate--CoA ligase family protein [Ahrensia sp.]|nr:phenylacetate--CoA ligase family protein [Ahrensia sp.]